MGKYIQTDKKWLDIGCGNLLHSGCIWIDISWNSKAEVIHNVEEWIPFENNKFDTIYCENIIEHIKDLDAFFNELLRVSKNGTIIIAKFPHYSSRYAWWDLTHIRPFSYDSFTMYWWKKWFDVIKRKLIYIDASSIGLSITLKAILFIPVLFSYFLPKIFERFFAYLFWGIDYIYMEFRVKK